MPIIVWNSAIAVDDSEIDQQHKKLCEMINTLHDSMGQGKGRESLGVVLNELVEYTKTHFAYEEKRMQQDNFIGYLSHKGEHDRFTKKVLDLQKEFQSGKFAMTVEVSTFLKDWLVNHIKGVDQKTFSAKK